MTEARQGQVTNADLYRELVGMRTDVGRALTRLEVIDARNKTADTIHADYETRLRALEAFRWKLVGLALAVSLLSSALGIWISYLAEHHG